MQTDIMLRDFGLEAMSVRNYVMLKAERLAPSFVQECSELASRINQSEFVSKLSITTPDYFPLALAEKELNITHVLPMLTAYQAGRSAASNSFLGTTSYLLATLILANSPTKAALSLGAFGVGFTKVMLLG